VVPGRAQEQRFLVLRRAADRGAMKAAGKVHRALCRSHASASPATGSAKRHTLEQGALVADALGLSVRSKSASRRPDPPSTPPSERSEDYHVHGSQSPYLGESVSEATIGQWLKKPGDRLPSTSPLPAWKPTRSPSTCPPRCGRAGPAAGRRRHRHGRRAHRHDRGRRLPRRPGAAAAALPLWRLPLPPPRPRRRRRAEAPIRPC
jgi:hypothetical protein